MLALVIESSVTEFHRSSITHFVGCFQRANEAQKQGRKVPTLECLFFDLWYFARVLRSEVEIALNRKSAWSSH